MSSEEQMRDLVSNYEALSIEYTRMQDERNALLKAVRKVEWKFALHDPESEWASCTLCCERRSDGHSPACPIGQALKLIDGQEAGQ